MSEKKTIVVQFEVGESKDTFYDYFKGDHETFVDRLIDFLKVCEPTLTVSELFLACVENNVIDGGGLMAMAGRSFNEILRMLIQAPKEE